MALAHDISGQRFGLLVAAHRVPNKRPGVVRWHCRCDCGNEIDARAGNLQSGNTTSCGCKHHPHRNTWAGGSTSEYRSWLAMRTRCSKPTHRAFPDYGGRGIAVCDRWAGSFATFLADMGPKPTPRHTIDRIDVNGNYEPDNCRWATASEQGRNTRRTKPGHSDIARRLIVALRQRGAMQRVIASSFGVSESFVSEVIHGAR